MHKIIIGLALAMMIGVVCRLVAIPLPAPTALVGTFLVFAMTLGYVLTERFRSKPVVVKAEGEVSGREVRI